MKHHKLPGLLAWMLALVLGLTQAFADPPGTKPEAKTGGSSRESASPPSTPLPAAPASRTLTDETLLTLLKNMGYEAQAGKYGNGAAYYGITVARDIWTFPIQVELSPNKQYLWLTNWSAKLPDVGKIPADKLLKVLEANAAIGPAFFQYDKNSQMLNLTMPMWNQDVTPASFRNQLEGFISTILDTEPVWNVQKWSPPG